MKDGKRVFVICGTWRDVGLQMKGIDDCGLLCRQRCTEQQVCGVVSLRAVESIKQTSIENR